MMAELVIPFPKNRRPQKTFNEISPHQKKYALPFCFKASMANLHNKAAAHAGGYTTSNAGPLSKSGEESTTLDKFKVVETHNFLRQADDRIPPLHRKLAEE